MRFPESMSQSVEIRTAPSLCSLTSAIAEDSFSSGSPEVWLSTTDDALSIWSAKNSPKFFIYMRHFFASTTAAHTFISSLSSPRETTAFTISDSFPTPDGSIIIRSGENSSITFSRAFEKSPTRVQHMQPEFISVISMPESLKKPPSIPICPNSFSIRTIFSPEYASFISFFISVVLPAPRKPE